MRFRDVHLNEVGRIAVLAVLFCAIMAVCFFVTARSAQSQPGVDSVDLMQREQALLKRAVNQSIENLRRYYARKEYDKVLEECKNLEKLDSGNNIAVYYRSIAKMGQTQEPFTVDLRQPSGEATVTSPTTRAIAFPRVVPPPSLAVAAPPVETPHAGVAPGVVEPVHPPEDQPEVLVQRGELRAQQEAKATKRGTIHELLAQASTRYIIIGVGAFLTFFIVFQIIRLRRKTRLAIEAARAEVVSRAEAATTELPSGLPLLEERADEKTEPLTPVAEELKPAGLYTDVPVETDSVEQEEVKDAESGATEETVSAVPEVEAVDISEETERDRLVSAIEGIPTGAEPVKEEDIGEVTLGAEEKSAAQPSALFSDEDIRPESEKAEVGAPEKKEQVEPEPSVPLGEEEEDLSQPDGSMKLDEFLFEQSGKPSAPPVPKPDDSSVEEWKRKAYDEDFEKMMFTPAAEDATSIGKRISEDETLLAPGGKGKPSGVDESSKKSEAKEPEASRPPKEAAPGEPIAPSPDDEETLVLPERETSILHPLDDEGPVKEPGESERDARAEASSPGDEDRGSTKTSARARQDELEISDDLRVTPEQEDVPDAEDGVDSQGQQAEVFGRLDLESLREVESEADDKAGAGASSKIMEERSEALFRDQYKKARDAFAQKNWQKAIHYFSVAVALRPNDKQVKENLRIARENRKKQENKKQD